MSAEQIANAFVQHYYQTFDGNAQNLAPLFVSRQYHRMRFPDRIAAERRHSCLSRFAVEKRAGGF
jgi:hypothetical protein